MNSRASGFRWVITVGAVGLILLGSAARFTDLDRHFYFHDEAATSLALSGYESADVGRALADGREVTAAQIGTFQHTGGRGVADTIRSLAVNDPQHPPLFFALARLWAYVAGSSITSLRALSALFGLLALAAGGWLAYVLFGSRRTALIAVALLAISPFQILYAKEAREYSLWVATVAASSAALLLALKSRSMRAWLIYSLTLAAALYTFPNTVLVVLGHGLFLLFQARSRQVFRQFAAAVGGAFILFLPWIGVMVLQRGALRAGTDWTTESVPLSTLLHSWLVVFGLGVFDKKEGPTSVGTLPGLVFGAVLLAEVAALVVLRLRGPRAAWLLVASLIFATAFPLMLADVATGGIRSVTPRYLAPVYLALPIALAFLISRGLFSDRGRTRAVTALVALGTIAASAAAYAESANARVWWNQDDVAAAENSAVAERLNRMQRPLLLSTSGSTLLEMSHYLRPETRIRIVLDGRAPPLGDGFSDIVFYGSPANGAAAARLTALLRDVRLHHHSRLQPVSPPLPCCGLGIRPIPRQFWRLIPEPRESRRRTRE
jgi:uncharacterized membrane protein